MTTLLLGGLVVAAVSFDSGQFAAQAQSRGTPRGLQAVPAVLSVDVERGSDRGRGTRDAPLKSLSAALAMLPDPLVNSVTVEVRGRHSTTGGQGMDENCLVLMCRMRPGVSAKIVGLPDDKDQLPVLAWEGGSAMVDCRDGEWSVENITIGTFTKRQRRGVMVTGRGYVTLRDVTIRTRSLSDGGIYAERGGQVALRGAIKLNDDLFEEAPDESFCGIVATDHGIVRFREREGASLLIGNGSLSASYYGVIRLGCESVRINCWNERSNTLAINNSGRIDLHGSAVLLRARNKRNTPIGLEHDGHILGEDAHVVIEGDNHMAIALQKASTFTCNDIELRGKFDYSIWASSGSMFTGRFLTDVGRVEATTGANINIEKIDGRLVGPVAAKHAARISLPDRDVLPE
ncbi:MAG: hypothetical protein JXO22_17045 [Phycisphaerae bacterium]|nr:hypothetical protein [Phycisphaerae bacterium]